MTKQRQPVSRGTRRFMLICYAGMLLSTFGIVMAPHSTVRRILGATAMIGALAALVYWWRAPVADDKPPKRSSGEDR